MSKNIKDGGPAYPVEEYKGSEKILSGGMSLRDYFAVHASDSDIKEYLSETKSIDGLEYTNDRSISEARYMFADAMIEEREIKKEVK